MEKDAEQEVKVSLLEKQEDRPATLGQWSSNINFADFFGSSEVMPKESIPWMIETLQQFMNEVPVSTRFLYKFDPSNRINFHKYIDGVPNLLLIVHLSNGTKIGGFAVDPQVEDIVHRPGKGFIFSLTDRKVYHMKREPRLPMTTYDIYYFVIGNSQLRLRQGQNLVYSNFGILAGTFDSKGEPKTSFLKSQQHEQPIDAYQFHEVLFD